MGTKEKTEAAKDLDTLLALEAKYKALAQHFCAKFGEQGNDDDRIAMNKWATCRNEIQKTAVRIKSLIEA